jgi:hypothetical protein
MASSLGPILAIGGITLANRSVIHSEPIDWRIPIATGIAAIVFSGAESMIGTDIPRGIAMVALVAVVFTRMDPNVPAPAESLLAWWKTY